MTVSLPWYTATWWRTAPSTRRADLASQQRLDQTCLTWSYGVGAEYKFTPQWSAVLQYDEHDLKFAGDNRDRISVVSLGARYRF
ncbi:outer membrane protein [Rhodoferax ferrireducens]|uniref:outer membrane protein n=1 Tax=Rhodoferax ferrireducens TaxID=192843 RepID=UPI000E0D82C8|nr:outer membrane beta-barrel protein [Rhodoferax ferrireducens]